MPDMTQEHRELLDMARAGLDPADYSEPTFSPGDAPPAATAGKALREQLEMQIATDLLALEENPS